MKFEDVPRAKHASQSFNVRLKSVEETLAEYKRDQESAGRTFELNPDFQRGHKWSSEQQELYIEYLLKRPVSGRDIYFNHPRWSFGFDADMVCVDGLQRLTAARAFLNNKIKAYGFYYNQYEDDISSMVSFVFHIGEFTPRDAVIWYLEMNYRGTPHEESELARVNELLDTKYAIGTKYAEH